MIQYKNYWRKTGLKKPFGDFVLNHINNHNVKNIVEVGVFCGVTARNICELLHFKNDSQFKYFGIDLFGSEKIGKQDEIEPFFLKNQKFSNPIKNIYYNYIKKENLNSIESVSVFLNKFKNNITLLKGDSRENLSKVPLNEIDYVFLDGGHSYETVTNDLNILLGGLKKKSVILCDDYDDKFCIPEVRDAINDFSKKNSVYLKSLANRFAEILLNH